MAPPRATTKKKDDSKDNSVSYEGDFFQFSPLFISIIIIFLMIFYWVSVDSCVFVRDHLGGERVHISQSELTYLNWSKTTRSNKRASETRNKTVYEFSKEEIILSISIRYFELLHNVLIFMSTFLQFVCYDIDVVPLHSMGPFGTFVSYLANNHLKLLRLG